MSQLVFYEKPGCIGNQQQKALLRALGCDLDVRDLLREAWTSEKLKSYFGNTPVKQWFNQSAPLVKSGDVDIENISGKDALNLMLEEPLLICRPLLELQGLKQSGFVEGPVLDFLGVDLHKGEDLQSCPMSDIEPVCEGLS